MAMAGLARIPGSAHVALVCFALALGLVWGAGSGPLALAAGLAGLVLLMMAALLALSLIHISEPTRHG